VHSPPRHPHLCRQATHIGRHCCDQWRVPAGAAGGCWRVQWGAVVAVHGWPDAAQVVVVVRCGAGVGGAAATTTVWRPQHDGPKCSPKMMIPPYKGQVTCKQHYNNITTSTTAYLALWQNLQPRMPAQNIYIAQNKVLHYTVQCMQHRKQHVHKTVERTKISRKACYSSTAGMCTKHPEMRDT